MCLVCASRLTVAHRWRERLAAQRAAIIELPYPR